MPRYYESVWMARGHMRIAAFENETSLSVLYAPERQVDARPSHARLLRHLVPEVLLRVASHDEQAAMPQPLRKCDRPVFSPEPEQALRTQADRGDYGPHFRLIVRMEPNAAVSIPVQVAEHRVVTRLRHARVGIGRQGSGFFYAEFQQEQFRYPRQRRIQPPLRLLLGSDSYAAAEKSAVDKIESDRNWKDLSLSTDYSSDETRLRTR